MSATTSANDPGGASSPADPAGQNDRDVAPDWLGAGEYSALAATSAAAIAAAAWAGRGDKDAADGAATDAMRSALSSLPGSAVVVIGEGEKDDAPMLYNGEEVGAGGGGHRYHIAVDPLECTNFCAAGLPGALATIAFSEEDCMWSPGPAFYMEKLVVPPAAREAIAIEEGPEQNLRRVAEALGKPIEEMRVVILDKPRHESLIEELRSLGALVATPAEGDVAGSLEVLLPDGGADVCLGIGGTPEGIMTACAARSLGGGMQIRLAPQADEEREAVAGAGLDAERVYNRDEIVSGDSLFVATGVTSGTLLRGPWRSDSAILTESIVIGAGRVQRVVENTFG
ncbi:MAG: class II fructose-bisphosphatase [Thermoleophilaceae bacterium]|nr:class II fructose-bisphosphatase [Thermoleophilaceae bacterium]